MIVIEGVDGSGKSTLAAYLAAELRAPIQPSEGPPHKEGEMDERLHRYHRLPRNTIFDRHPCISQSIYSTALKRGPIGFDSRHYDHFDMLEPFIIYCDPLDRALNNQQGKFDTAEHLKQITEGYLDLLKMYRAWAVEHAHYIYRIGDDRKRLLAAVSAFDPVGDISEFHERFHLNYTGRPRHLPPNILTVRATFMAEELGEYFGLNDAASKDHQAMLMALYQQPPLVDQLDALVDLVYVALGTSYLHGFDFREAWSRVHKANMNKVRALRDDDSKRGSVYDVVKPSGWLPADLDDLVV